MPKLLKAPVRLAKRVSRSVKRVFRRQKSKNSVDELLQQQQQHADATTAANNATTSTTTNISPCDRSSPSNTKTATSSSERIRKPRTDGRILSWWRRLRGKGMKRRKPTSRRASFQAIPPLSLNHRRSTDNNHKLAGLPCDPDTCTPDCNGNHVAARPPQASSSSANDKHSTSHGLDTSSKLVLSDSAHVSHDKTISSRLSRSSSRSSSSSISNATPYHSRRPMGLPRLSLRRLSRSASKRKGKKSHSFIVTTPVPHSNGTDSSSSTPTSTLGFARFGQAVVQARDSMDGQHSDQDNNYIGHGRDLRRYALSRDESSGSSTNTGKSNEYRNSILPLEQGQQHGQTNESNQASCDVSVNNELNHNTDDAMLVNAKQPAAPFTPPMNTTTVITTTTNTNADADVDVDDTINTAGILLSAVDSNGSSNSYRDTLLFDSRRASSVAPALPLTPVRSSSTIMDMHIDENSEFISNFSAPFNQLLLNQKMDTAIQSYGSLAKSYDYSRNDGTATLQDKGHSLVPLPTTVSVYAQQYLMSPSQLALIISHKEETKQATITIKEVDNEEDIASDEKQEEEQELEQENQFTDISISNDTMVDTTTTSLWGDTLVARQESSVRTTVNDMTFEKQMHSDNDSLTELVFANRSTDLTELESKNCDLSSTDDSLLYDATPFGSVELQDDVVLTIQSDETFNINLPSSEEVEEQDDDSCDSPVLRSRFSLSIERSNSIQIESILECVNQLELPTVDVDCSETIDRSFFDLADTFMMQLNVKKDAIDRSFFDLADTFMMQLDVEEDTNDTELYNQFYNELLHNTMPLNDPTDPEEAVITIISNSSDDDAILTIDDCPELAISSSSSPSSSSSSPPPSCETSVDLPINYTTLKASDDTAVTTSDTSTTNDMQRSTSAPAFSDRLPARPRRFIRRVNSQDGGLRSLPARPSANRNGQGSTYRALHQRASSASDALLGCLSQIVTSAATSASAPSSRRPSIRGIATSVLPQFAQRSINSVSTIVSNAITTAATISTAAATTNDNDNDNGNEQLSSNIDTAIESDNTSPNVCRQRITTATHQTTTSDRNESVDSASVDVPSTTTQLKTTAKSLFTLTYLKFVTFFWICLIILGICLRAASAGLIFGPNYLVQLTGFICRTITETFAFW